MMEKLVKGSEILEKSRKIKKAKTCESDKSPTAAQKAMSWARYCWNKCSSKIGSSSWVCHLLTFLSALHRIFMIYLWMANGMSQCGLYLLETRESGDEREEQKQENGLIDLIWILLSAVRVMMMMM